MQTEQITARLANLTEASYAKLDNSQLSEFIEGITSQRLADVHAIIESLANREIIAPLYKGFPSTLNCLRKALRYLD